MRAFVRLRQMIASHAGLAQKLETLERKHDAQFKVVFDAIRQLMGPPDKTVIQRQIDATDRRIDRNQGGLGDSRRHGLTRSPGTRCVPARASRPVASPPAGLRCRTA